MGKTSIKNKLILSFLLLLLIVMVVVAIVNKTTADFFHAQAISSVLAMVAGIIFGNVFSKSFLLRLNRLNDLAKEVSRGDLTKQIEVLSLDELRDLEGVFADMVVQLRSAISETKALSYRIQETNTQLTERVNQVLDNSHEINESAQAIAGGSEQQTHIVQETSVKVEQGLEVLERMVRQSVHTVTKINEARRKAESGEDNARETLEHLEDVLKRMAEYSEPVYRLASKVEKIQLVIKVMDEIAQKTDLLSLNASIEATRAGDAGKGFALVANEIRAMAENSKTSSQEIGGIVEDILEDNRAVAEALRKSQEGIERGRKIIRGIVTTFGDTLSGVKDVSEEVEQMADEIGKQGTQLGGLRSQFEELSRLAQENFASTRKTTVSTRNQEEDVGKMVRMMASLNALSQEMVEKQHRFKLPEPQS